MYHRLVIFIENQPKGRAMKKCFFGSALMFPLLQLSACSHPLDGLKEEVNQYGYALHLPPTSNHGPGWTFAFAKTSEGKTRVITICENLFPDVERSVGNLSLPNLTTTSEVNAGLAVEMLSGIVDDPVSAKANLSKFKKVEVSWGRVVSSEIPISSIYSAEGVFVNADPICAAFLKEMKEQSEVSNSIFVVVNSLTAHEFTYNFGSSVGGEVGAQVDLQKALTLKPNIDAKEVVTGSLTVTEPREIGYVALALTDVVEPGLLSPAILKFNFDPIEPNKLEELSK